MRSERSRASWVALVLASLVACASSSSGAGGGGGEGNSGLNPADPSNSANCPNWASTAQPLEVYRPGMSQKGSNGLYDFTVTSITPAPPALATTTWVVKVTDMNGQPVADAKLDAPPGFMPQHNHSTTAFPVATPNGDGTFTVENEYFFMKGVWQVTFKAISGTTTDSTVFTFCLGM